MSESEIRETLSKAAEAMELALSSSTGLGAMSKNLVTYWTLATHSLPYLGTFPLLSLSGKMGTGKSQTLRIIKTFSYKPQSLSLRNMTLPAIRDEFARCHEGTAIIEEADQAWKDNDSTFERLLSDRYQRDSARSALKEQGTDKVWKTSERTYFGASVLHRRIPFNDAALDGRTVFVRFRADHSRRYGEFVAADPGILEISKRLTDFTFRLPETEQPQNVAARVFCTYMPLLATANLCGDRGFGERILPLLVQETYELKEAQSSEPDGLVLRAIVESVFSEGRADFANIKFSSITDSVWKNHRFVLHPRQVGTIARELGFSTKTSHGVTVIVPTPAALLKACKECDYTDEAVEDLKAKLLNLP